MVHHLFWFLAGGWIGSFITLVMVALMRKNREVPKPYDEKAASVNEAVEIDKNYDAV